MAESIGIERIVEFVAGLPAEFEAVGCGSPARFLEIDAAADGVAPFQPFAFELGSAIDGQAVGVARRPRPAKFDFALPVIDERGGGELVGVFARGAGGLFGPPGKIVGLQRIDLRNSQRMGAAGEFEDGLPGCVIALIMIVIPDTIFPISVSRTTAVSGWPQGGAMSARGGTVYDSDALSICLDRDQTAAVIRIKRPPIEQPPGLAVGDTAIFRIDMERLRRKAGLVKRLKWRNR